MSSSATAPPAGISLLFLPALSSEQMVTYVRTYVPAAWAERSAAARLPPAPAARRRGLVLSVPRISHPPPVPHPMPPCPCHGRPPTAMSPYHTRVRRFEYSRGTTTMIACCCRRVAWPARARSRVKFCLVHFCCLSPAALKGNFSPFSAPACLPLCACVGEPDTAAISSLYMAQLELSLGGAP